MEVSLPRTKRLVFPSFRPEHFRIRTVNIFAPMHGVDTVANSLTLRNEDRAFSVWSATEWKEGIFGRLKTACWNRWIESKH
jgi:hypothetical protein